MIIHLVPVGKARYELYAEPPDEPEAAPPEDAGFVQRWSHTASVRWRELVDAARHGSGSGRVAHWRNSIVCRLAEHIAEQRTLWTLRDLSHATLLFPSTLDCAEGRSVLNELLATGRRHHGRWLIIDTLLLLGSAVLAIVPGPNLVAYYFLFRLVGHLQSWRGARDGLERVQWGLEPNQSLSELAGLVDVPRAVRASRVQAIAARLNVPRLSAFFDRSAAPSA
jgi:hypothetical protein